MTSVAKKLRPFSGFMLTIAAFVLFSAQFWHLRFGLLEWSAGPEEGMLQVIVGGLLLSALLALGGRVKAVAVFALLGLGASVSFMDLCYYRYFGDLPSLHLLPLWFQGGKASESLSSILTGSDALLAVWPSLGLALLILFRRWEPQLQATRKLALLCLALTFLYSVVRLPNLHEVRLTQLQRRFHNKAIGRIFGLGFYHLYDALEWARVQFGVESSRGWDSELVAREIGKSRKASLESTPQKGKYEGRDLIFIQLESLEYFALHSEYQGQKIMPFLSEACARVSEFELFDQTHLGRSADAQFMYLNSLHPPANRALPFLYPGNSFFGLPFLFAQKDYATHYLEPGSPIFWNSGILSESYGFQHRYYETELPPEEREKDFRGWGLTDAALYQHLQQMWEELAGPGFFYVVTVMCHHPYNEEDNPDIEFPPPDETDQLRCYLRCAAARDRDLQHLMKEMAKTERGRKAVFCLAGDHDSSLDEDRMKRSPYPSFPESETVPVLIGSVEEFLGLAPQVPSSGGEARLGAQIDLAPSIGHVFSLNMEESMFVGQNLWSAQKRDPNVSRRGTRMDLNGRIQETRAEDNLDANSRFQVSEMLLQADKIRDFRKSF